MYGSNYWFGSRAQYSTIEKKVDIPRGSAIRRVFAKGREWNDSFTPYWFEPILNAALVTA